MKEASVGSGLYNSPGDDPDNADLHVLMLWWIKQQVVACMSKSPRTSPAQVTSAAQVTMAMCQN